MELLTWLEQTDFSTWLRESDWGYPSMLCVHAIGMGMVVGISLMYSARILGYAKPFPLAGFDKLFALAWFGFAINAASGVLLFVGEPRRLAATPAFWIKMILIVFAGLSLWALAKALHGEADPYAADGLPGPDGALAGEAVVTTGAKIAAICSIVFWLSAITAGRIIGYTMPPPPL
jgi:hypothetical protein